ncbi:hypothetical protein CKAH01_13792 [Colletotrichum kahawae]|uniref:F-box domain-containing protein n=1 Tax=Colletotrichum kahawae TaxID=34407 RepID=A0AAD9YRJ7_COLKA|nr:hypothetical protein CKAH01_13792 [Colletotrichum kahawae]
MFSHDVSSMMIGKLSGGPDLFGKETGARLPLLFTKVMEARPAASQSLLFRLPPEILGDIMDLIADEQPSLASLALVNSDCRQLARSCQFAVVTFDYSPASRQLAQLLSTEAASADSQHKVEEVTITDCDTDTAKAPDNGDSFPKRKPQSDCDIIAALIKRCEQSLETLVVVHRMFPMGTTEERLSLSSQDINLRSLRTLNLSHCQVDSTALRVMLCPSLRHLSMPWEWDDSFLSCETLRNLDTLVIPFVRETPGRGKPSTASLLMKFLNRHPHIKKLCLDHCTDAFIDNHLLPCLSNSNWTNLNSLSLAWQGPGSEESTRPHIARVSKSALAAIGSLDTLEQLSLTAGVNYGWRRQWLIDHDTVRECHGLEPGRDLRLCRSSYRDPAPPDPLFYRGTPPSPTTLAISRDTYPVPYDLEEPEYYYEIKVVDLEDHKLANKRDWMNELEPIEDSDGGIMDDEHEIWEYAHRYKMFKQAEKYAEVIPTLEWVYCGEWPMKFVDGPVYEDGVWDEQTTRKVAWPLAKARDSCWSYLQHTFGMGHEED